MKLRNKILAMAVVAVAGMNVWNAVDETGKLDLSQWNLEKLAYADPTLESFHGYEIFQNGDYMIYSKNDRVVYCYGKNSEDCGVQVTEADGQTYTCKTTGPYREY